MNIRKLLLLLLLFTGGVQLAVGQVKKSYKIVTVAFYNLENLFDYLDDPSTWDEAYTPEGTYHWERPDYEEKVAKLATTISQIGTELAGSAPVILGLCEVENFKVLQDLVNHPALDKYNYDIIHFDSPDKRGIDTALLFQKRLFLPVDSKKVEILVYEEDREKKRIFTRDILLVSGLLDGEKMHVLVNHWPSRRGGEIKSRYRRIRAAQYTKRLVDSIWSAEPYSRLLIMGDFNDDPTSYSIKGVLNTKSDKTGLGMRSLYNPMENMFRRGLGTLAWRDGWNLFDQIILSSSLVSNDYNSFQLFRAGIFNKHFLMAPRGKYRGYPFRSFNQGGYTGGYSDHFPVFVYLIKEASQGAN